MDVIDTNGLAAFSDLLKTFRKRSGISQQQLAARLGVHRNTIGTWERGDFLPDSKAMVLELARLLGLNADETRQLLEASLTTLASHWCVPYARNPFFTGRETLLRDLHEGLYPQKHATPTQCYALCGLGGVGKTQTVIEYAYRHSQEYAAVLWVAAETYDSIVTSFVNIAHTLQLSLRGQEQAFTLVELVAQWLNTHSRWLLVLDNVEDIGLLKRFLPASRRGSILLTTRLQALAGIAQCIEMQPLTLEEGTQFLLTRARQEGSAADHAAAHEIVTAMDGLPLALDQAGAYIEETHCRLPDYLDLLRTRPVALLRERDSYADHPSSLVATLMLAFTRVQQNHPAAADLLIVCALLAPDAIPEELLTHGALCLGPALQPIVADPLQLNAALKALLTYSLIQRDTTNATLSMHRLVQTVLRASLTEEQWREWSQRVIRLLNHLFPGNMNEEDYWSRSQQLLPHVLACLAHLSVRTSPDIPELPALLTKTVIYLLGRERYDEAEPLALWAVQSYTQTVGVDHLDTAFSQSLLATIYIHQGQYNRAESLLWEVIHCCERLGESDHPYLAHCLSNLATIYYKQGNYSQAEPLVQRALLIGKHARSAYNPYEGY